MRLKRLMAAVLMVALSSGCRPVADSGGVKLAAAASLTNVLDELLDAYESAGGRGAVSLRVGGSDFLARQIAAGGDADVFIAADTQWMSYLIQRGLVREGDVRILCPSRLVLVTRPGSAFSLDGEPRGRLAIAEPETVPAGRYARQALQSLGLRAKPAP